MSDEWPTSWDDEPWPLEDPSPGPALRPTSWSDSLAAERAAMEEFAAGIRTVAEALANIDLPAMLEQLQALAEPEEPAIRYCPRHGPMAKGGFCRRCGR